MNRPSGALRVATTLLLAAFATVTTVTAVAAVAADSSVATWTLNVAKSNFSPGPGPRSRTITIEAWGADGIHYISDAIDADGKPSHWEYRVKYDGRFMPYTGNPRADSIRATRIDANTIETETQLKGVTGMKARAVVSADGRTRTLTETGRNAKGEELRNVAVYDRQ